jgi:TP901 family phage tail tape measure protein
MAVVQVEFRANANFSDLIAQTNAANASVKALNASFGSLQKQKIDSIVNAFNQSLTSSGQYTAQTVRLTSEAERFGKALDRQKLSLRDYHREYQSFKQTQGGMIRELARQQTMLERSVVVSRGRDAQGRTLADVITPTGLDNGIATKAMQARKELQIMNKVLNDGATSLINWGKNTQWAGRQLTVGLTVPLTILGGAAAKMAYDLDMQMTKVVKVYGNSINAMMTAPEVTALKSQLTDLAKQIAQTYGQSATDTLDLAAQLAAAGKTGSDLTASITQTTKLATLGEIDRADAMAATLSIQTAFKQSNAELADSINFLNAVENQTSSSLQDFVEAIPKTGPIIKGLGGDIKDLALMMVAMKEGGVPATEAANAIKSGLSSLINPTRNARDALSGYGISMDKIQKDSGGKMMPMILGFKKAIDGLDTFSRSQVLEKVFGKMQFARMSAMFSNIGEAGSQTVEVMKLMGASTEQLAGIADSELKALSNSISGQFNRALESMKVNLASVGDEFLVLGTKALQGLNWIFDKFDSLPDIVKKALGGLGLGVAIIGPVIMTVGVLGNLVGYLIKGFAWFKSFGNSGVRAFGLLNAEMVATKHAGDLLEKSMFNQSEAANVLNASIEKLIASLAGVGPVASNSGKAMVNAINESQAAATRATMADHEKQAFARQGQVYINPIHSPSTSVDMFNVGEVSHFSPTSHKDESVHGISNKKLIAGSSLVTPEAAYMFQREAKDSFHAQFMNEKTVTDVERKAVLQKMVAEIKAPAQKAAAQGWLDKTGPEGRAQLLPTIQAVKGINAKYVAQLQALATMSKDDLRLLRVGMDADVKQNGRTRQQALAAAMKGINSTAFHNEIVAQIDSINASEKDAIVAARKISLYLDDLEARARAAMKATSGLKNGSLGFSNDGRRGYGVASGMMANLTNEYNTANMSPENRARAAAIAVRGSTGADLTTARAEYKAAMQALDASREQERAARLQSRAAAMQLANAERGAVTETTKAGAAAMDAGMVPGGAGGKMKKFGKYAGVGAGVALLGAGAANSDSNLGMASGVAGGAMTGAMMGMMLGPEGAAVGAVAGAIMAGLPMLVSRVNEATAQMNSLGVAGETAASKFGASVKTLADVHITNLAEQTKAARSEIDALTESFKNAAEGSADAAFIKLLTGESDKNNLRGLIGDKITSLLAAGVKPDDVKKIITAALTASGQSSQIGSIFTTMGEDMKLSVGESIRKQLESARTQWTTTGDMNWDTGKTPGFTSMNFDDAKSAAESLTTMSIAMGQSGNFAEFNKQLGIVGDKIMDIRDLTPQLTDEWKDYGAAMEKSGGTSAQMLQLIALKAAGLNLDLQRLTEHPYEISVVMTQFQNTQSIDSALKTGSNSVIDAKIAKLRDSNPVITAQKEKSNKAAEDAQQKHIDAIGKMYDKQIEAEKKRQADLQRVQDAEKRRLDREKSMRDDQVGYNQAIAAGNFGQAALIKNNMDAKQAAWALEDKQRGADEKNKSRLDVLETAKASALDKEKAKLDALKKAHEAVNNSATSAAKKMADSQIAALEKVKVAVDEAMKRNPTSVAKAMKEITENPANMELLRQAGVSAMDVFGKALRDEGPALTAGFMNQFGKNLVSAPWDLIENYLAARISGDPGDIRAAREALLSGAPSATPTNAARAGAVSKATKIPFATGGYIAGQGHGTSDQIDARLSNGEYVVTNAAVNWYGKGMLDQINTRQYAEGGIVQPLAQRATADAFTSVLAGRMSLLRSGAGMFGSSPADPGAGAIAGGASNGIAGSAMGSAIARYALQFVGVPYSYSGSTPQDGWGCAPFVRYLYDKFGYNIPGGSVSNSQYNSIKSHPDRGSIGAGDLVFFKYANGLNTGNAINHVGMALSGSAMIHAANPSRGTIVSGIDWANYRGAARPVDFATGVKNYSKGGIAMLGKPGEYMVNDSAVQHYGTGFMNAVNNQTYHGGGLVTAGGPQRGVASGGDGQYSFIIYGGDNDPSEIADEVMRRLDKKKARVGSGR